jgi:hypothetical protein
MIFRRFCSVDWPGLLYSPLCKVLVSAAFSDRPTLVRYLGRPMPSSSCDPIYNLSSASQDCHEKNETRACFKSLLGVYPITHPSCRPYGVSLLHLDYKRLTSMPSGVLSYCANRGSQCTQRPYWWTRRTWTVQRGHRQGLIRSG